MWCGQNLILSRGFLKHNNMEEMYRDYSPMQETIMYLNARIKALEIENERLKEQLLSD